MKKRLMAVLLTVFILMITGCANSNSADEQNGADSQIADNTDQTNTGKIENEEIFRFEIRYTDDTDGVGAD